MRREFYLCLVVAFLRSGFLLAEASTKDIVVISLKNLESRIQRFEKNSELSVLFSAEEVERLSEEELKFVKSHVAAYGYPKDISIKAYEKIVVFKDPFSSSVEINLSDILSNKIKINGRNFDVHSFSPEAKVKDTLPQMLKELEKQQVLKYVLNTQEVSWLKLFVNVIFLPLTLSSCAAGEAYNSLKSTVATWLTPSLNEQQMSDGKMAIPLAGPSESQMKTTEERFLQEGRSPSGYHYGDRGSHGNYSNFKTKSYDSYEASMVTWRLGSRRGKSRVEHVPAGAVIE